MRRVDLDELQPGMKIALPIRCSVSYSILLGADTVINESHLKKLGQIEPSNIYVTTPDFSDYPQKELYSHAVAAMDEIFSEIIAGNKVDAKKAKSVVKNIIGQLTKEESVLLQLARLNNADSYSASHCVNVCIYSLFLGQKLNIKGSDLSALGLGAILHDIGKLRIPQDILRKPEPLSDEEYAIIKEHPFFAYSMLDGTETNKKVSEIVLDHHEFRDGSGYPTGKTGGEINMLTRIVTIADIYDAVTTDRAYRPRMLPHEGMEILIANSSADRVDPGLVQTFMREISTYPEGTAVRLNTSQIGIVSHNHKGFPARPRVRVSTGSYEYTLDLLKKPSICIVEILDLPSGGYTGE